MIETPAAETGRAAVVPLEEAYMLMRTAIDSDRASEAERVAEAVLSQWPDDVHANLLMGEVELELGRYDEARTRFERALDADPEDPNAHLGLAVTNEALGDPEAAVRSFRNVLRLDPSLSELRPHLQELAGGPLEPFDRQSLILQRVRSGDWLAAVAESYALSDEELSEPWLEAALVEALWGTGRAAEACSLATAQRIACPSRLKAALVIAWKRWSDGDTAGAESLLSELRPYDPVGRYIRSHAHSAPYGWKPPEWSAVAELPEDRAESLGGPAAQTVESQFGAAFAVDDTVASVEAPDPEYAPFSEPAEQLMPSAEDADDEAADGAAPPHIPSEAPNSGLRVGGGQEGELVAEQAPEPADGWLHTDRPTAPREPLGAASAAATDLSLPEAPSSPTVDVPDQPELPDLPDGAGVEQPDVQPDRQPFEAPRPEVTDVPPSYTPEMPSVPAGPGVSTPGTTPPSPMGEAAEIDLMIAGGQFDDALDACAAALRSGSVDPDALAARLAAMEGLLVGRPRYHRLLGDLYTRRGLSRRAMKEYRLAMDARLRRD